MIPIETERLIIKHGKIEDYVKVHEFDFNYLNEKILSILSANGEVKYWGLIADCMCNSVCNFCQDIIFIARIDDMINNNIIKITKTVQEKNYIGELKNVK